MILTILNQIQSFLLNLGVERIIAAERDTEKIAVEIKSFLNDSQVYDLERAIGQYVLYEELLKLG